MRVSFVHDLDPNTGISNGTQRWEIYDNEDPKLMLFDDNVTSDLEDDTWIKEEIDFVNLLSLVLEFSARYRVGLPQYAVTDLRFGGA